MYYILITFLMVGYNEMRQACVLHRLSNYLITKRQCDHCNFILSVTLFILQFFERLKVCAKNVFYPPPDSQLFRKRLLVVCTVLFFLSISRSKKPFSQFPSPHLSKTFSSFARILGVRVTSVRLANF